MKQGGGVLTGKWQGSAAGGVVAPDAIILPIPASRFAQTESRLRALAGDHPMRDWLLFLAELSKSQHEAIATVEPVEAPSEATIELAVNAQMPPLAADGHHRASTWYVALAHILDATRSMSLPAQARAVATGLRSQTRETVEALADRFLRGRAPIDEAGAILYVAAALQVYFTMLAAKIPEGQLRPLPQQGLCPACGSTPSAGLITATGKTPGIRYLYCSLCSTAWNHVRAICITCGDSRHITLEGIEGDAGVVKAETCGACHTYAKMIYQKQDAQADPYGDDLATLGLDLLVADAGWSRHAPNPLVLVGGAR
jgi:FdhE protein